MTSATIDVRVAYSPASPPAVDDGALRLHLPSDAERPASLELRPHRPGVVRDALLAIGDVLASDLRVQGARSRGLPRVPAVSKGKGVEQGGVGRAEGVPRAAVQRGGARSRSRSIRC